MVREIKIQLLDNPSVGDGFGVQINVPSQFYSDNLIAEFNNPPGLDLGYQIPIGATYGDSVFLLYNFLDFRYRDVSFITVEQNEDGATIYIDAFESSSTTNYIVGDILINYEVTGNEYDIILSRSPYFINIRPSFLFDKATLDLKIYRGDRVADVPLTPNYTLSKLVVQAGQENISFDIHKIINDFVKNNYSQVGLTGAFTTSLSDSVWIQSSITAYYQDALVATSQSQYLAVDGFGYHIELFNPTATKKVLSSINNHILYIDSFSSYPLYFLTAGLISINVNGTSIPFTFNQDISNQVIAYINVQEYAGSAENFEAVFEYEDETVTHVFLVKSECKFETVNCIFKNKYGFWETMPFSKLSRKSITSESSDYLGIISNFGEYSLYSHGKKEFNFSAKEKITVNTDFIPEEYNTIINELMLSEFVYLQQGDKTLPVNLNTKTIDKKTKVNDKLVRYTMEFEYSYNIMNQVI